MTLHSSKRNMRKMISIHTALAGCDHDKVILYNLTVISIHTALAGCDIGERERKMRNEEFQSTQPSQAVTTILSKSAEDLVISIHTVLAGCDLQ